MVTESSECIIGDVKDGWRDHKAHQGKHYLKTDESDKELNMKPISIKFRTQMTGERYFLTIRLARREMSTMSGEDWNVIGQKTRNEDVKWINEQQIIRKLLDIEWEQKLIQIVVRNEDKISFKNEELLILSLII